MSRTKLIKKYPRNVSTLNTLTESEVAVLLALGYSNRMIRRTVKVSDFQIQCVVRTTGIKRKDYRDGRSDIARWVADKAKSSAATYVKPRLLHQ